MKVILSLLSVNTTMTKNRTKGFVLHILVSSSLWSPHQSSWNTTGYPFIVGACRRQRPILLLFMYLTGSAGNVGSQFSWIIWGLYFLRANHIQVLHFIPADRWAQQSSESVPGSSEVCALCWRNGPFIFITTPERSIGGKFDSCSYDAFIALPRAFNSSAFRSSLLYFFRFTRRHPW